MNIKVRFTAPEDLDLIALVHSGVRMGLVIRDVLRAYVRQEIFYVPIMFFRSIYSYSFLFILT